MGHLKFGEKKIEFTKMIFWKLFPRSKSFVRLHFGLMTRHKFSPVGFHDPGRRSTGDILLRNRNNLVLGLNQSFVCACAMRGPISIFHLWRSLFVPKDGKNRLFTLLISVPGLAEKPQLFLYDYQSSFFTS